MKKDIIVFDVDGTLCESSKQILEHHAILLNQLKQHYDIAICGGGTLSKILNQINNEKEPRLHHLETLKKNNLFYIYNRCFFNESSWLYN